MNDEQLIWETYSNNNLLLESLDKVEFYPYDRRFSFYEIFNRSKEEDMLHKTLGAFFHNQQG
jgi:hypothetical protein